MSTAPVQDLDCTLREGETPADSRNLQGSAGLGGAVATAPFAPRFSSQATMRQMEKRVEHAETAVQGRNGMLVVIKGCDETEEQAIVRAGAENFTGHIVIIRRFGMTAAQCEARRLQSET